MKFNKVVFSMAYIVLTCKCDKNTSSKNKAKRDYNKSIIKACK